MKLFLGLLLGIVLGSSATYVILQRTTPIIAAVAAVAEQHDSGAAAEAPTPSEAVATFTSLSNEITRLRLKDEFQRRRGGMFDTTAMRFRAPLPPDWAADFLPAG